MAPLLNTFLRTAPSRRAVVGVALVAGLLAAACGGSGERAAQSSSAVAQKPPAPDYDAVASRVAEETQRILDERAGKGFVSVSFGQVVEHPQYGRVLLIHTSASADADPLKSATFTLVSFAWAVGASRDDLGGVAWGAISFAGPGSTIYTKIADLVAFTDGAITAVQLRQRTVFPP